MRLTIVGSGTIAPHYARVSAGHWIEAGPVRLLLDCGNGVVHRLAALGLAWPSITHLAITHFHVDHVGDVAGLIGALQWGQIPPRHEPLAVIGPVGTLALLERLAAVHGPWVRTPEFAVAVRELEAGSSMALAPGIELAARAVPHTAESVAYSVRSGRARVVFTGDTGYDEGLADWAAGCDVLLAECSLPEPLAIPEHLTPRTAGELAARARPGRLVLTHFYPPVEHDDIAALVGARWDGPVVLARDGTTLDIEE
jgi:ribonuclease BN (tRNA processing enzyme)